MLFFFTSLTASWLLADVRFTLYLIRKQKTVKGQRSQITEKNPNDKSNFLQCVAANWWKSRLIQSFVWKEFNYSNQKYFGKAETGPPVHDVGQSVHTNRVSGQQGWIKDSSRRHHHQGQPVLHKCVTHLREQKPGKKQTGQTGSC